MLPFQHFVSIYVVQSKIYNDTNRWFEPFYLKLIRTTGAQITQFLQWKCPDFYKVNIYKIWLKPDAWWHMTVLSVLHNKKGFLNIYCVYQSTEMGVASVWVGQGAGRVDMGAKKYSVLFFKG